MENLLSVRSRKRYLKKNLNTGDKNMNNNNYMNKFAKLFEVGIMFMANELNLL